MSKRIDPASAVRKPGRRRVLAASGFTLTALAAAAAFTLSATPAFSDAMPGGNRHLGQYIFRFDTFGDEQLWTDTLRMHEVIQAAVSPRTALAVGLKVDAAALPPNFLATRDLDDPATTVELLRRNAVVGVVSKVEDGQLTSVGITCALCHSTVDNSVAPGVGRRVDGWPNLDLNPGAIIALSPALPEEVKAVYNSWGPGRYDPRFNIDGINGPLVIPPAYGLAGVPFETFSGDGPISYWNNYVAVTQMGGHGNFSDPRLGISIEQTPDLVTPKLPQLLAYQLSLPAPRPPEGSVNAAAAQRGAALFNGTAGCGSCHIAPTYTDVHNGPDADTPLLHDPAETGMDPGYAQRSATGKYRSTPLRALWQHPPYFHDGSAPTLGAVVDHYDTHFALGLTPEQKADLVAFLKSL
ncbi:Cytochrome c [Azoarcus sp. Aa7]|nr:Cytochrome c [Azoarcus sp. Aa7]